MSFEGENEYADEYVDDGIPGDNEAGATWGEEQPAEYEPEAVDYNDGFIEGSYTAAGELARAQMEIADKRELADAAVRWQKEVSAYEGEHGRPLSHAERSYLVDAAEYFHEEHLNPVELLESRRANMSKEEIMMAAMDSNRQAFEVEHGLNTEEALPGPAEGWGLSPGAGPMERAQAKTAWSLQQARIQSGELIEDEDD